MSFRSFRALALLCIVVGCGDGSGLLGVGGSGNVATVRFVNATATPLDLAIGGIVSAGNANIGSGSGVGCFPVADPTVPSLSVRSAGSTANLPGFVTSFVSGGRYTVVAFPGPSGLAQFISIPSASAPVVGRSALRVLNAAAGIGVVDAHATTPGGALVAPSAAGVGVGSASTMFDVPAGVVQVRLTTTGTTTVVYDAGSLTLAAGRSYTLIVSSATSALLVPDCE